LPSTGSDWWADCHDESGARYSRLQCVIRVSPLLPPPFTYRESVLLGRQLRDLRLETELGNRKKTSGVSISFSVPVRIGCRTGFARDSGYEWTFSKLPKVIQVPWKLPKQKNFYLLINGSFNQIKLSLRSNISGGFGHKCRRLPMTRWRCRRKYY